MINHSPPINGLIAELEECLGKLDASGELLAGAHLSSAIDSLRASVARNHSDGGRIADQRQTGVFTVH